MKEEQKIYIKGNLERGSEVIKILTDLGGKNTHSYAGDGLDSYYFIDPCGVILVSDFNSEVFSFVKEFYKEINLPKWKPKYDETYYYFTDMQGIMVGKWKNNLSDRWRYDFGNCFKSYDKAKAASNKIKELLNNKE